MLPYTVYKIPESTQQKIHNHPRWLGIIVGTPISDDDEELLQKICAALHADYSTQVSIIIVPSSEEISLHQYSDLSLFMSFGIKPSQLGVWIDLPSAGIKFLESFSFILTVPLPDLAKSPTAKKQLWTSMQTYLELIPKN